MEHNRYISPFETRYASKEMQYIFSEDNKFRTWRRLWIALAKAEKAQGLPITQEQIDQLEAHKDDINYDVAIAREKEVRHDVMSHVYAYGVQCPDAKGIIHLGATSCYVGDNTDILVMKEGLQVIRRKLLNVIALLADFARKYKDMPALAYTHSAAGPADHSGQARNSVDQRALHGLSGSGEPVWRIWHSGAARVLPEPRPVLWNCLTGIPSKMQRLWRNPLRRSWVLRR